ncbi:6317_t:CDS:1 [Gigaspora margarita]|uniref:6317_t:CDS:1 n=1 Tax=Gigaspora margarita TaxID=4874 RepID=A0ABN7X385_GIGMA|nr:6317_t:CDS:1 [Gigaspora margarita]
MFKFNTAEYKNNIRKKIDESLIDNHNNVSLNKITFYSKYNQSYDKNDKKTLFHYRSNSMFNDYLCQNFEIYKIIESVNSHTIYHHYYQILPTPNENHIIILHYGDNSASKMEILFHRYMLKNQKKHDKKYKTIKEIEESSTKELTTNNEPFDFHSQKDLNDYEKPQSYKIKNIRNRSINDFAKSNKTCEFQSLRATKTDDADLSNCITFRMNEIDMLNASIENVKLQLKELRGLFEVSENEKKDLEQKFGQSEKDLKQVLESLHLDHCQLKDEWSLIKSWKVKNEKIRKEFFDLYNFHKFGELNGGVRCLNRVHA